MLNFDFYQKLTGSDEFKDWQKDNPEDYLSHFYCQINPDFKQTSDWEIGYYNPRTDKITTFLVGEKITLKPEEEVFKKEGKVARLEPENLSVNFYSAIEEFKKIKAENYSQETLLNGFLILQNWQDNLIWNVSFATKSLKVLNIKLDAVRKEVVSHELIDFIQQQTGKAS